MSEGRCGCGEPGRYSFFTGTGEVLSCNKYRVCPTYEELHICCKRAMGAKLLYQEVLEKIVSLDGCDYEYKAWAKAVLEERK